MCYNKRNKYNIFLLKEQAKMRKYFSVYKDYIQKRINVATKQELETLLIEHLEKIEFIKHERLIHLLVTMLFVFMLFMSLIFKYSLSLAKLNQYQQQVTNQWDAEVSRTPRNPLQLVYE